MLKRNTCNKFLNGEQITEDGEPDELSHSGLSENGGRGGQEKTGVNGDEVPQAAVKCRFLKLDYGHIEYVLDCLKKNTTKVKNIKSYLLTSLYNSLATIGHYYTAEVNHDFYGVREENM